MKIQDVFNSIPENPGYVDLDNLGKIGAGIHVQRVGTDGVNVVFGKKGNSFDLTQYELGKVEERYNLLKREQPGSEVMAGEYTDYKWPNRVDRIRSPYVARIVHWMLDPKHSVRMPGINMDVLKDPDLGGTAF